MHIALGLVVLCVIWEWIKWDFRYNSKRAIAKRKADEAARNAYAWEQQQRREQIENLDYQLKMEQLEALRRQNRRPPQPPLELV